VEGLPLRRLVFGHRPGPERIFFHNLWFRGHNNPRYAELLPRLERLDRYLLVLPDQRLLRGVAYRAARATQPARDDLVFRLAAKGYRHLFTADNEQIALFPGHAVADVDDPMFSPREVELLSRPNLAAYVVTADRAGRGFEELGVQKPWHVIPQGVSIGEVTDAAREEIAARHRSDGEVVVGYMAAWLLSEEDRGGKNPLYNVDHLFELWDEIRARVPKARLWLLGGPSDRVRARCAGRSDVVLLGRVPREHVLAYAANFDLALYPRTADQGIRSVKVAEYMGMGVPTVSYDYEVTADLRETGAGVLVGTPREFVEAVERLATDEGERRRIAEAARAAGRARNWDVLAREYAGLLDKYLPRHA
jgi:glycosyltransferase involved in cell wall biosynthesis